METTAHRRGDGDKTMTKKSTAAQAAAMIRKELKALLPGTKFSVTSDTYSMGNSVNVTCEDLPPFIAEKVRAVIGKYKMGRFNGTIDCYEYTNRNEDLPQVKFTELNNRPSADMTAAILLHIKKNYQGFDGLSLDNLGNFYSNDFDCYASEIVHKMFTGKMPTFWENILERIKAA